MIKCFEVVLVIYRRHRAVVKRRKGDQDQKLGRKIKKDKFELC